MDRQITEQIVDNALLNDKEGFMSAFQAAMATKVADALEVKKVEVASNMLGAAEVAQEDTLEEEVEQVDEAKTFSNIKQQYNRNENENRHTENTLLLAKHFGTEEEKSLAQKHMDALNKHGHQPHYIENSKLHTKLLGRAKGMKEEVEQVEEANMRFDPAAAATPTSRDVKNFQNRSTNRRAGAQTNKYIRRMTKLGGFGPGQTKKDTEEHIKSHFDEEVEQVEEGVVDKIKQTASDLLSPGRRQEWADSKRKRGLHTAIKRTRDGRVMSKNQEGKARSFGQSEKDLARRYTETGHKPFWWKMKEDVEQIDEAKAKMTDAHKKIAKQVHRELKSDDQQVSQVHGDRIRNMHSLLRRKYGSNWRALAGINEGVEQIDEMEKDVSGPGRDGDGAHFTGSRDKKPIKMTGKERKTSDALAGALKRLAAKKLPK